MEELQEDECEMEDCTCKSREHPRSTQGTSNVYSQPSGLEDVVFNDFIKDEFILVGDGQVTSDSASLPSVTPEVVVRLFLLTLKE